MPFGVTYVKVGVGPHRYLDLQLTATRSPLTPSSTSSVHGLRRFSLGPGSPEALAGLPVQRLRRFSAECPEPTLTWPLSTVCGVSRSRSVLPSDGGPTPPPRIAGGPALDFGTAWTADQVRAFLSHVHDDRLLSAWRLMALTGMRRGEVCGLRRQDLHLADGYLSVRQALVVVDGKPCVSTPKSDRGRRDIYLDAETLRALAALPREAGP